MNPKKATDLIAEIAHVMGQIGDPNVVVEVKIGDFRSPIIDVAASPKVPFADLPRTVVLEVRL